MAATGAYEELAQAEGFITGLTEFPIFGARRPMEHMFFVPGNHDVSFDKADIGQRWQQWTVFHNRLRGTRVRREEPWTLVAVMPSLDPGRRNEARLWIERHPQPGGSEAGGQTPVRVVWSAGPKFPMIVTVDAADDPRLCAVFHYYGPMLVQAEMHFTNGEVAVAHVYVRIPQSLGPM